LTCGQTLDAEAIAASRRRAARAAVAAAAMAAFLAWLVLVL
jgi:hypothetical protein